jgi:L-cysteine S-thiosulfotransferase
MGGRQWLQPIGECLSYGRLNLMAFFKFIAFTLLGLVAIYSVAQPQKDTRRSGSEFMSPQTQAMQNDDTQNPGMLWVKQGESQWNKAEGAQSKSCASCHNDATKSMRGVATKYPLFDAKTSTPINLSKKILQCRTDQQQASTVALESQTILSLEAYVAHQSRGLPIKASVDAKLKPHIENGKKLYTQPLGQLNLSCAQCHDQLAGQRLGSAPIPEAHPNGYPIYRLEWQGVGSLQRRLRNCMSGVRAEGFAYGSKELIEIELYLVNRANGMLIEAPGVRP